MEARMSFGLIIWCVCVSLVGPRFSLGQGMLFWGSSSSSSFLSSGAGGMERQAQISWSVCLEELKAWPVLCFFVCVCVSVCGTGFCVAWFWDGPPLALDVFCGAALSTQVGFVHTTGSIRSLATCSTASFFFFPFCAAGKCEREKERERESACVRPSSTKALM